jgi:hypothetical protein
MKRLRRILKWIGISTGAAITILLMANAYFVWSTGTRLERRLRALRQAGDPVLLADLARAPIPPEQNADVFLRRAAADLDAIQKDLLAWYPKTGCPTGTLSPADQERLETLFAAYPKLMPLLEQAANCPGYDPQLDGTLPTTQFLGPFMEHSTKHRVLTRVLRARTALLLSQGRTDQALATQILALRLARHWRREPLIIGYLMTVACENVAMDGVNQVLQAGPVSASARQALDAELVLHDTMEGHNWALRTERSYSLSSVQEMLGSGFWLTRGFVNDLTLRLVELFDRYLEKAARPYAAVVSERHAATRFRSGPNPYGALVTLLEPALAAAREPAERVRAMSRSLRVLGALQVHASPGSNRVPNLNDLGLPAEATIDPFSGKPLHVKKLPQGWMVYSVGSNLVDDGGKLDWKTDIGVGPISRGESQKKP